MNDLIFHQLFEPDSSSYTYLLADSQSREAVIIDSVLETAARDLALIRELNLDLKYILETHIHADHITGAGILAEETKAKIGISSEAPVEGHHLSLKDNDIISFGSFQLKVLATPGHTNTCMSFALNDRVFTGDTLLIDGNGRTDFQDGSSEKLFHSIKEKLYTLPDSVIVFPGHDYKGRKSTTIGQEKLTNNRINQERTLSDFVQIMNNLKLPMPKKIDIAIPANLKCGRG